MMQRLISTLKQKELLVPSASILALVVVLSFIIVLSLFFHQSLEEEMANQFNQQQLLLSREVGMNIESYIDHVYKGLKVISQLPDIEHIYQNAGIRSAAESINFSLQNEALLTIRVLDKNGIALYDSSYPGKERISYANTDYFNKTRVLPRSEKHITELLDIHPAGENTKEFIIAMPVYQTARDHPFPKFNGVVLAILSLNGITQKYLSPIKSGTGGYAWMIDSDGTLLYHPTQQKMTGNNLYHNNKTCLECHKTLDPIKQMVESATQSFGMYEAPGGHKKLAAVHRFPIARKTWTVVVSAPYADVTALMKKSQGFYSLLIISIFVTTLAASGATIFNYKKKIKAEEKAKNLESRRLLEREIEIQKDFLENIIENTKTNLLVLDKDLIVRTLNTAQAITLGRAKDAALGQPFFSLFPNGLPPYENIEISAIFRQVLAGRSFELRDYPIAGLQPATLYLSMSISPILINGTSSGILVTSNDVTKRVQLEEALKQYAVELEDKVVRGTATAKKLEQQVLHSEKLAALGKLAAGVAHEIGNPLTSISTFAQLLREMANDDFSRSSLDIINTHIQRISDIVRRMSTFARADTLNIKPTKVNDVVNSTLDLMRLDKRMKGSIDIEVSLDSKLPLVMVDEGQLSQVFINIIINAFDAMPEKGKLLVTTRTAQDDQGNESVMISFKDTGIGIQQQELVKLFDPFYTTKEVGKGTGLGLSLSYNIIKHFKGDIKVESTPGVDTTFTIILPIEAGGNKQKGE